MPTKPKRGCSYQGCSTLIPSGSTFCAKHKRPPQDNRASSTVRGYDSKWQALRKKFLKVYPHCSRCGDKSKIAHHVIPRRVGGKTIWGNLEPLCESCHNAATQREKTLYPTT